MAPSSDLSPPGAEPRFGQVAVEMKLLRPEQLRQLLDRQGYLKSVGLAQRIDELAIEMGMLARIDCDYVLGELHKRREALAARLGEGAGAEAAPVPPCRFGPFELEQRLPSYPGLVFKALDRRLQVPVAVKVFPSFLSRDQNWAAGFQRDARIAARLSHPNLPILYGAGDADGRCYTALEYVEGQLLSTWLGLDGRLREPEGLRIARDMACALYHAHVLGLLFRDVRPELVLLDPHGRARFCDLGVGKVLSDDPRLIAAGLAPDTPAYLAPEQVRGNRMAGRRADLYGLGATLFRMLCGRCPYEGSPAELSARILAQDPPDPATIVPDLSPGSRELLKRLLARNPEDRPSEADDVVAELDKLLAPRGQPADKLLELAAQLSEPHVEAAPAGAPAAQPGAAQPPPASPPTPAPLPHLLSIPRPRPRR